MDYYDEAVVTEESPRWPDRKTYHGHDGVRQAWEKLCDAFEDPALDAEDFIETDDGRVVVFSGPPDAFRIATRGSTLGSLTCTPSTKERSFVSRFTTTERMPSKLPEQDAAPAPTDRSNADAETAGLREKQKRTASRAEPSSRALMRAQQIPGSNRGVDRLLGKDGKPRSAGSRSNPLTTSPRTSHRLCLSCLPSRPAGYCAGDVAGKRGTCSPSPGSVHLRATTKRPFFYADPYLVLDRTRIVAGGASVPGRGDVDRL